MNRILFVFLVLLIVAGCEGFGLSRAPTIPSHDEVRENAADLLRIKSGKPHEGIVKPWQCAAADCERVERLCTVFFDGLSRDRRTLKLSRVVLVAASALAILALEMAGSGADALPLAGGGSAVALALIDSIRENSVVAEFPHEIRPIVFKSLGALSETKPATAAEFPDIFAAHRAVQKYAVICTRAGILNVVRQALRNAKVRVEDGAAGIFSESDRIVLAGVAANFGVPILSDDHVIYLYWLVVDGSEANKNIKAAIRAQLSSIPASKNFLPGSKALTSDVQTAKDVLAAIGGGNRLLLETVAMLKESNRNLAGGQPGPAALGAAPALTQPSSSPAFPTIIIQ